MFSANSRNGVSVTAYRGNAMTLLAFDITDDLLKDNFVGFSVKYKSPSGSSNFLTNRINFVGDGKLPDSDDAPFQKFRWVHVPGTYHQKSPKYGTYKYYVTPRYWNATSGALEKLDPNLTVTVEINVNRFEDTSLEVGFTRSFLTSQAFVRRFGENNDLIPKGSWLFDTSGVFCVNEGQKYTYEDVYGWLGFTARERTIELLEEVLGNDQFSIDMFAYDFDEPVMGKLCLDLASKGRIRVILDNSSEHSGDSASETDFEKRFNQLRTGAAAIVRGKFSRFAHDKVIVVKEGNNPVKVLTGSTNFSVTGFCVNANHIAVFNNEEVAALYEKVFEASWGVQKMKAFRQTEYATRTFDFIDQTLPNSSITFAPHNEAFATQILDGISSSIKGARGDSVKGIRGSVLFCIMSLDEDTGGSVYPALRNVQNNEELFTYGITDSTKSVSLYKPGSKRGILVNAKSLVNELPPPFDKEQTFNAHNIHHKFVVVDFNTANATVYLGSSNLALGGEKNNGDNLICIRDIDVATAFAIEAVRLIDHYHFRAKKSGPQGEEKVLKLDTTSRWAKPYFDTNDIKYVDRKLFAAK
ncbi:MAG: phospholipase D-like domain-containing protein [Syntrophales bacterium LBB04]|nr:phospholipase D-like domain-containing protein [Syntrophales bacterium LBB04]